MKKWDAILLLLFGTIIFGTGIYSINRLYGLTIGVDDFGYISNAAFMLGKNWKGLSEITPYYSFGYSALLVLFLKYFSQPVILFRAIVIFNVILLVISYYISVLCLRKLHKNISNKIIFFTCFVANMYTANFVYGKYVLAESLLILLFWVLALLLINICRHCSNWNMVLLGILCSYMYFVHQRTLVVIGAVFLTIFILLVKKRVKWHNLAFFFIPFVLLFITGNLFKTFLIDGLYDNNINVAVNNFSGQLGKLYYLLSPGGMLAFVKGLFSKLYYFLLATLFTGGFGLLSIAKHCFCVIREKPEKDYEGYIYIFFLLSFLFSFLLQGFSLIYPNRYDLVIYGRYIEFMFGIIIAEGLIQIFNGIKEVFKWWSVFFICASLGVFAAVDLFGRFELSLETSYLAPALYMFYSGNYSLTDGCYISLLTLSALSLVLYFIFTAMVRVNKHRAYIMLGCLFAAFWFTSTVYIDKDILNDQLLLKNEYMPMVESIEALGRKVGFLLEPNSMDANRIREMQFLLPEKEFERLSENEITQPESSYLIILEKNSHYMKQMEEYAWKKRYENYRYVLYEK